VSLDFFAKANWVDVLALILIIRITYVGSLLGVGAQILPFFSLFLTLCISLNYYNDIAVIIAEKASFSLSVCRFCSFTFIFLFLLMLIRIVKRFIPTYKPDMLIHIERVCGGFMGFLRSMMFMGAVAVMCLLMPVHGVPASVEKSSAGLLIIKGNLAVYTAFINLFPVKEGKKRPNAERELRRLMKDKDFMFQVGNFNVRKKGRFYKREF